MNVWYCIPSKRGDGGTVPLWRERGYKVALFRDTGDAAIECDMTIIGKYPGYATAVNMLVSVVLDRHPDTEWIVTGGDDVEPDLNISPEQIAAECSRHFADRWTARLSTDGLKAWWPLGRVEMSTFGVMQPTGDRWGADPAQPNHCGSAYADRVCCSPWMGAEFCRRMYGGTGPLWDGWHHMRVDEELQEVAKLLGVLWQRRDLIHLHRHWARSAGASPDQCPAFLREVNGAEHWALTTRLFDERKAAVFPGHEPLARHEVAA